MALYATTDELNELTSLVRTLLGNITTLDGSVGRLDTLVERINHLSTLKDVTITYITEGDLLQYSSDGTWHNISPAILADYISGEGGVIDTAVVKALIKSEGDKLFLSKLYDDTALGIITFNGGLKSNKMAYLYDGVEIGTFLEGIIGGTGARIDKDGRAEMTSLTLREFLEVPELRFNKVDVVNGELWNSIAFGTVEAVDTKNLIVTLRLEDGEYSGLHVNDICRGIFHNLNGSNETVTGEDENGFTNIAGFSTSYFTPLEILDAYGKRFRYSLKPGTTLHPCVAMKFAVYGNFTDTTRQSSAYSNREYKRHLKNVSTWAITWRNIASQFGKLDGLTVDTDKGPLVMEGDGVYASNIYLTDALVSFKPSQLEDLKGQDAYSVSLTKNSLSVMVDNELNIVEEYSQLDNLTFAVQAFRGTTELVYSDVYGEGNYFLTYTATGVRCTMNNGVFKITDIISTNKMSIDMVINCEGEVEFHKTVNIEYNLLANGLWVTYNDNDNIPDRPTGDGTTNGWHRNYTSSAIWMSTKSSISVDEGEWGDPNRFRGASVAGADGEYTVFAYTESSVQPQTPTGSTRPPVDPSGIYTWYMTPPKGDVEKGIWVWQSIQTVYSDKSTSGWSTPFRLTGADGKDGEDGNDIEFLYKLTLDNKAPILPANSNLDDYQEPSNGWYDNPQGVSEIWQYEWAAQRIKPAAKSGTGNWGNWKGPTVWSKWGEKGMDGDGYEYIYYRTDSESNKPDTPIATGTADEEYPKAFINGVWTGYYWTDDPKGVKEDLMFEWVSTRKKTDGVWSNFQSPALWAKWGETGLSGGNYQYRYKISETKPDIPTDDAALGWSTDSEMVPPFGSYVWLVHRFANADGTTTAWTGLIRLTGADGKDGEDGNNIEFIYTRNGSGIAPASPSSPGANPDPSLDEFDWAGTSIDTNNNNQRIQWYDNPLGVDSSLTYEWVSQRYLDKTTLLWEDFSDPGMWSRYAEKGKDGDGYEYIYYRFADYDTATLVDRGESYYPASPNYGSDYIVGDYLADDHIPSKTCKGVTVNYTDNPEDVNDNLPYQVCWTRRRTEGVWGDWKDGFIWTYKAKDGATGDKGDLGEQGKPGEDGSDPIVYEITPDNTSRRFTKTGSYVPSSITFKAYLIIGSKRKAISGYWEVHGSNSSFPTYGNKGSEITYTSGASSYTPSLGSSFNYITVSFATSNWPIENTEPLAVAHVCTVSDGTDGKDGADGSDGSSNYVISRFRGAYSNDAYYYYSTAAAAGVSSGSYPAGNPYIRDIVYHSGYVWLVANLNSTSNGGIPTSTNKYWTRASTYDFMTVNTLLANDAWLGKFLFSNNIFTSCNENGTPNGNLVMDSVTGELIAKKATITGEVNAEKGTFVNGSFTNCTATNLNCTNINITSGKLNITGTKVLLYAQTSSTYNITNIIDASGIDSIIKSGTANFVLTHLGGYSIMTGLIGSPTSYSIAGIYATSSSSWGLPAAFSGPSNDHPAMHLDIGYVSGFKLPYVKTSSSYFTPNIYLGSQIIYLSGSGLVLYLMNERVTGLILYVKSEKDYTVSCPSGMWKSSGGITTSQTLRSGKSFFYIKGESNWFEYYCG